MANIVITHDANFLIVDFGVIQHYSKRRKIRKTLWADTDFLDCDQGVQIDVSGSDSLIVHVDDIDSIDGITTMTTNEDVCTELEKLM